MSRFFLPVDKLRKNLLVLAGPAEWGNSPGSFMRFLVNFSKNIDNQTKFDNFQAISIFIRVISHKNV